MRILYMLRTGLLDLDSRSHNLLLILLLRVVGGAELQVFVELLLALIDGRPVRVVEQRLGSLHLGFFVMRRL